MYILDEFSIVDVEIVKHNQGVFVGQRGSRKRKLPVRKLSHTCRCDVPITGTTLEDDITK